MNVSTKLAFLSCLFTVITAMGQSDVVVEKLAEDAYNWSEGSVLLNDGTELFGVLKFDDKTGLLSYKNGDNSKTLIARNVAGFEFYDEKMKRQRVFYSLEFGEDAYNKKFHFFEVLKEFKAFAVLSKVDPIEIQQRTHGNNSPTMNANGAMGPSVGIMYTTTEVEQTETIYFMDINNNISPYVKIVERDIDGLFSRHRTKNKFIAEELFQIYAGDDFQQLVRFADENDLSFKSKKDLIRILDHYEQLLSN